MRRPAVSILALVAIAAVVRSAWPALAAEEPPARVGRVSVVEGTLAFHAKGETEWSAAPVNFPVAAGGSLRTDAKSRVEIRIGAQTIELSDDTAVDVIRLDHEVMQLGVPQGRIELHLRQLPEGQSIEVDIPRGGVWLLQPGLYDIAAGSPDRPARIMVIDGNARFVGGTVDIPVKTGEAAVISGTDTLSATNEKAAPDAFVEWCRSRDYKEQRLSSPYYLSPAMTGYEELDDYGSWRSVADYGAVWYPKSLPAGWVPYRNGYWSWVAPWGWNWVSYEPWGFAPFHYGRWAYVNGAWGWVPGSFLASPVYAPALVAFLADPAALLFTAATAPLVGWFPLGPREAYWPSYTNDPSYIRAVNSGIVGDPASFGTRPTGDPATANAAFANRRAATIVPQQTLASGARVAGAAVPVSNLAVESARVTAEPPSVQPSAVQPSAAQPSAAHAETAAAIGGAAGAASPRGGAARAAGQVAGAATRAARYSRRRLGRSRRVACRCVRASPSGLPCPLRCARRASTRYPVCPNLARRRRAWCGRDGAPRRRRAAWRRCSSPCRWRWSARRCRRPACRWWWRRRASRRRWWAWRRRTQWRWQTARLERDRSPEAGNNHPARGGGGLEDPGGAGAVTDPHLRLTPAHQGVARRIDRVEESLFLVEIGAVEGCVEPDDPAGIARPPANLECHDRHSFPPGTALPPRSRCFAFAQRRPDGTAAAGCLSTCDHYPQRLVNIEGGNWRG